MYTFRKNERLCNLRLKSLLFDKGDSFFHYPFRVIYVCVKEKETDLLFPGKEDLPPNGLFHFPAKCLTGVSGKRIKKASQRNRIKRLIKESYRKNKTPLYSFLNNEGLVCLLGLIYTANRPLPYEEVEKSVRTITGMLPEKIRAKPSVVYSPPEMA